MEEIWRRGEDRQAKERSRSEGAEGDGWKRAS